MHEQQTYSDMSGVQLDDGAFVLRWFLPPCSPLLANTPRTALRAPTAPLPRPWTSLSRY